LNKPFEDLPDLAGPLVDLAACPALLDHPLPKPLQIARSERRDRRLTEEAVDVAGRDGEVLRGPRLPAVPADVGALCVSTELFQSFAKWKFRLSPRAGRNRSGQAAVDVETSDQPRIGQTAFGGVVAAEVDAPANAELIEQDTDGSAGGPVQPVGG